MIQIMLELEGNKDIIRDQAVRGKCTLVFGYDVWQNVLKPIGKDLRNDFIGGVTEANGAEFYHSGQLVGFWYEGDVGFVYFSHGKI